jgi:hypothetical protein
MRSLKLFLSTRRYRIDRLYTPIIALPLGEWPDSIGLPPLVALLERLVGYALDRPFRDARSERYESEGIQLACNRRMLDRPYAA